MAELVEQQPLVLIHPVGAVVCAYCGQQQDAPEDGPAYCLRCHVGLTSANWTNPAPDADIRLAEQHRRLAPSARATAALAELDTVAAPAQAPKMVEEMLAAERRGHSYLALVPFLGPWLVRRSEVHTQSERRTLSLLSVGVTVIAIELISTALPTPADQLTVTHRRVHSEIRALADVAESYRTEHRAYPDAATWKHFCERADPRFFDPWGRPYRYEPADGRITLGTLGRNGIEGGTDEDADMSFDHFPAESAG